MTIEQFIEHYFLKTNEVIDTLYIYQEGSITTYPIMKKTPRRMMKTAEIIISTEIPTKVTADVIKTFHSPNVRKTSFQGDVSALMEKGILLKEVRFKKDGKTVENMYYRMGYGLFQYMEQRNEEKRKQEQEWNQQWRQRKQELSLPEKEISISLYQQLTKIEGELQQNIVFPYKQRWPLQKRQLFLEFLLAAYQISWQKNSYDWKEIGAVYYQTIGGSKMFDPHKKDFLDTLEEIMDMPPWTLGIVSTGTVTPIFFCGPLQEGSIHYPADTVRALTDLAVVHNEYTTNASVLWLVENRAVLTRMAAEPEFILSSGSLVIGVDGQLRSGHKKIIRSLVHHDDSLKQVIIWTDYDEAGKIISDTLFDLLKGSHLQVKWISPQGEVWTEQQFSETFTVTNHEQEEQLGGVDIWKKWINS